MARLWTALTALALVVGCNGDDSDNATGTTGTAQGTASSCDLTNDVGYCLDFDADAPKDQARNNCANAESTLGYQGILSENGSCPTANRVGSCAYTTTNGVKTTYRYYASKFTSGAAEQNCSGLKGSFSQN